MSTRAVIAFKSADETFHVYQHEDGDPLWVARGLQHALHHAWQLPRFEPSEFAAAYIAANKHRPGGHRIGLPPKKYGDLSYAYEVTLDKMGVLQVRVFDGDHKWLGTRALAHLENFDK